MKESYFARMFLAGFALGLFAGPQHFILTTPDNLSQIGKGMFETGSGNSIQVRVTVRDKEFTGSGTMTSAPPEQNYALRSDRAFMESLSMSRSKYGFATLKAKDGSPSSLVCEFNVRDAQVDGHCFDPVHKQSPAIPIHPSHENQP